MSEAHVFSSRDLTSTAGEGNQGQQQLGGCLEVYWATLANNSKEGFSCLIIGVLLGSV